MIDQKAREIAYLACLEWADACGGPDEPTIAARLGIIEGLEMAAKVAEVAQMGFPLTSKVIAAAIRALIEEQKI